MVGNDEKSQLAVAGFAKELENGRFFGFGCHSRDFLPSCVRTRVRQEEKDSTVFRASPLSPCLVLPWGGERLLVVCSSGSSAYFGIFRASFASGYHSRSGCAWHHTLSYFGRSPQLWLGTLPKQKGLQDFTLRWQRKSLLQWIEAYVGLHASKGVPPEDIFVDHAGFRTLDTIVRAKKVFLVENAVFVSQAVFLPRAIYLALDAGLSMQTLSCDPRTYQKAEYYRLREVFARHLAYWDAKIWDKKPKYLGTPFPITESGEPTWKGSIYPETSP